MSLAGKNHYRNTGNPGQWGIARGPFRNARLRIDTPDKKSDEDEEDFRNECEERVSSDRTEISLFSKNLSTSRRLAIVLVLVIEL